MVQSLILITTFGTVVAGVYLIYLLITFRRRQIQDRISLFTSKAEQARHRSTGDKKKLNLKDIFRQSARIFEQGSYTKKMELELSKADIPLRGEEFVLMNLLLASIPALLCLMLLGNLRMALIACLAGFALPKLWVRQAITKRMNKFNSQIGDTLSVMSNSLKAGFSFLQAMELVGKEMSAPIADEFARTLREINLGTTTEQALANMGKRIGSDDLDLMLTAVLTQRQVGGNLSEILDSISHTIRERIRVKGEIKTITAQGRVSGIIIALLPVAMGLILYLVNPSYIGTLFTTPIGMALIVSGLISETIGYLFIKKIVDVEV